MQYRRALIPGTSYFFTLVLQDRRSDLLIRRIKELRQAFKQVIERYPFIIDGVVVMPDHLHMIMTLPQQHQFLYTQTHASCYLLANSHEAFDLN